MDDTPPPAVRRRRLPSRRSAAPGLSRSPYSCAALLALAALALGAATPLAAQSLNDGVLMPHRTAGAAAVYGHERWDRYWEGTLRRDNENIGTHTTQSVMLMAAYGVTDRLTLLASLPYVRTDASQGNLSGMRGVQDLTLGAKYGILAAPVAGYGTLRAAFGAAVGTPLTDYTPDFQPMSIGMGSRRASGHLALDFQSPQGWFASGATAYTLRSNVTLDREAYYTNGKLYLTNEVSLPDVAHHSFGAGYRGARLQLPLTLTQQRTLGGGDIRRQDMPFIADRMNFVRLDGSATFAVPSTNLALRAGAGRVVSGRNVGQTTTLAVGVVYMFSY